MRAIYVHSLIYNCGVSLTINEPPISCTIISVRKIVVVEVIRVLHTIVVHNAVQRWLVGIRHADVAYVPQF